MMNTKRQAVDEALLRAVEQTKAERMRTANRLYRAGLKLREVGDRLEPPVTAQRVAQLLDAGAAAGLFTDPRADRRHGVSLTEHDVRAAANDVARAALPRHLHVDRAFLEASFGSVLDAVYAERRAAKIRARAEITRRVTIEEYRVVAARLGRNPTSSDITNGALCRRIFKHFGTFESFMSAVGVRPNYVKQTWRERERQRGSIATSPHAERFGGQPHVAAIRGVMVDP